jgi:hypothetical protein
MVNKVRKYHSMCETVESVHTAIETQGRVFFMYQDIPIAKPTDGLKYEEPQLENIWRWVCWSQVYGHDSGTVQYIEKSKKPALP